MKPGLRLRLAGLLCLAFACLDGQTAPPALPGIEANRSNNSSPAGRAAAAPREAGKPAAEKAPAVKTVATPGPKDLKYPPLRPVQQPNVETFTLANGLRIYLMEDHELPLINGQACIRTGSVFDPPDKIGLAAITAAVLRTGGTKAKTGEQIDQQLESLGASVDVVANQTGEVVSFAALKESADPVLELFRDLLTAPEFRQDKMDLQKTQVSSAIARRNDEPGKVALRELAGIVYGRDTPYGWQEQYDTVGRINRADLQSFHRRYYFPKNVMLAVWGDFNTAAMKSRLTELFGGWTADQPPVGEVPRVKEGAVSGVYLAERKDVRQTFLAIGHLGGQLKDKDYPALRIAAGILGGADSHTHGQWGRTCRAVGRRIRSPRIVRNCGLQRPDLHRGGDQGDS
jgi:zinc protease